MSKSVKNWICHALDTKPRIEQLLELCNTANWI